MLLRNRAAHEPMTWKQDHLRALPTRSKPKSNVLKNVCIGVFAAWLIGMVIFFAFYFNQSASHSSTPLLRKATVSTSKRTLSENFYDGKDDSIQTEIKSENLEPQLHREITIPQTKLPKTKVTTYPSMVPNQLKDHKSKLMNDKSDVRIDKEVQQEIISEYKVVDEPLIRAGNDSQSNNRLAQNISDPNFLGSIKNLSRSSINHLNIEITTAPTSPPFVGGSSNKEINVDSVFKRLMKERQNKIKKSPLQINGVPKPIIHHVDLIQQVVTSSTTTANKVSDQPSKESEESWEAQLLRSAHEKIRLQYPECSAKIRWYCHEKGVDCSSESAVSLIDAMQTLVVKEATQQRPHCPPVSSFSMARVWKSAWFVDEKHRRNSYVPRWRESLLNSSEKAMVSSVQLRFSQQFHNSFSRNDSFTPSSSAVVDSTRGVETNSLLIMVLTYPRPNNQALLIRTVNALQTQMNTFKSSNYSLPISVAVMNSGGSLPHPVFNNASRTNELNGGSKVTNFAYFNNSFLEVQPIPEPWVRSRVAQQISNQSWHVMSALAMAVQVGARFTMIVEDDMELCEGALPVLVEDIKSADSSDADFTSLLVSYGLNGLVLRTSDIAPIASRGSEEEAPHDTNGYLLDFLIANRNPVGCEECVTPPDIAVYEWSYLHHYPDYHMDLSFTAKANRPPKYQERVAYTRSSNLFSHLGTLSSTFDNRIFEAEQYRCGGVLQFSHEDSVRVLRQHSFSPRQRSSKESDLKTLQRRHDLEHDNDTELIDVVKDSSGGRISVLQSHKKENTKEREYVTLSQKGEKEHRQVEASDVSSDGASSSLRGSRGEAPQQQANDAVIKLKEKKKLSSATHHTNIHHM